MTLSFRPACLAVAHGSLPHTSPLQALRVLLNTTSEVPTWPQLPRRSFRERGDVQSVIGFPGLMLDEMTEQVYIDRTHAQHTIDQLALAYLQNNFAYSALTNEDAPGLVELRRSLHQSFQSYAVKGHISGPISLGLQLVDEQQRPLLYDPMLMEALAQHVALRATWQVQQLAGPTSDLIMCLDEPFLDAFNSAMLPIDWEQGVEWLEMVFAGIAGCRGLAASGMVNWALVLETSVECIHFDAFMCGEALVEAAVQLNDFLARSGTVIWGIVPADEKVLGAETVATLFDRFKRLLEDFGAAGVANDQLLQASLISTNGGLFRMSIDSAEHALALGRALSTEVRTFYDLT